MGNAISRFKAGAQKVVSLVKPKAKSSTTAPSNKRQAISVNKLGFRAQTEIKARKMAEKIAQKFSPKKKMKTQEDVAAAKRRILVSNATDKINIAAAHAEKKTTNNTKVTTATNKPPVAKKPKQAKTKEEVLAKAKSPEQRAALEKWFDKQEAKKQAKLESQNVKTEKKATFDPNAQTQGGQPKTKKDIMASTDPLGFNNTQENFTINNYDKNDPLWSYRTEAQQTESPEAKLDRWERKIVQGDILDRWASKDYGPKEISDAENAANIIAKHKKLKQQKSKANAPKIQFKANKRAELTLQQHAALMRKAGIPFNTTKNYAA